MKSLLNFLKHLTGYEDWIWGATARFFVVFAVVAIVFLIPALLIVIFDVMH